MPKSAAEVIHIYHKNACELADRLRELRPGAEIVPARSREKLEPEIERIELLLVDESEPDLWSRANKLRFVQVAGVGVDHFDGFPGLGGEVTIANLRGVCAASVAEHALATALALHRGIPSHLASQAERAWRPFACAPLAGETAMVLGLGEVGLRIARALTALELEVIGVCRSPRQFEGIERVMGPDDFRSALGTVRLLVAALPLTAETRGLIGDAELSALADHALVVNVGRGAVFDEAALAEAALSGQIGGVALDTFTSEPLPADDPLWLLPNAILSPHVAGWTPAYDEACLLRMARNLDNLAAARPLEGPVDLERGY